MKYLLSNFRFFGIPDHKYNLFKIEKISTGTDIATRLTKNFDAELQKFSSQASQVSYPPIVLQ